MKSLDTLLEKLFEAKPQTPVQYNNTTTVVGVHVLDTLWISVVIPFSAIASNLSRQCLINILNWRKTLTL